MKYFLADGVVERIAGLPGKEAGMGFGTVVTNPMNQTTKTTSILDSYS